MDAIVQSKHLCMCMMEAALRVRVRVWRRIYRESVGETSRDVVRLLLFFKKECKIPCVRVSVAVKLAAFKYHVAC